MTFGIRAIAILEKPRFQTHLQSQVNAMEKQAGDFEKMLVNIQNAIGAVAVKQDEMQAVVLKLDQSMASWRPQVDAAVKDLQVEMEELRAHVEALEKTHGELGNSSNTSTACKSPPPRVSPEVDKRSPLLPTPPEFLASTSAGEIGLDSHHVASQNRGRAPGVVTTLVPPPVKGTSHSQFHSRNAFESGNFAGRDEIEGFEDRSYNHRLPKLDFPQFDGSDPQSWRMTCKHYFGVYGTHPMLWVRVATIYFTGRAASWLRSSRSHMLFQDWSAFCAAVDRKFDREQHQSLIRQIEQIKQTGSVEEFYERFDDLVNQLLVYDPSYNSLSIVHRFTEGLRPDSSCSTFATSSRPRNCSCCCLFTGRMGGDTEI